MKLWNQINTISGNSEHNNWIQGFAWVIRTEFTSSHAENWENQTKAYLHIYLPEGPFIYLRPPPKNKNKTPSHESSLAT